MMHKIWVYVAGPFTIGSTPAHVRAACRVGEILYEYGGFVPFVPHLNLLWEMTSGRPYDFWMELDGHYMARCDCLVRLPGDSAGADIEVEKMREVGKPVVILTDISDESVERAAEELLRKLDPRPEVSDV